MKHNEFYPRTGKRNYKPNEFCCEPILRVYEEEYDYDDLDDDAFLQLYGEAILYTTFGYWIVLETENTFIRVGAGGVCTVPKDEFKAREKMAFKLTDNDNYKDDLRLLFTGERLLGVEEIDGGWDLSFGGFTLRLLEYEMGHFPAYLGKHDMGDVRLIGFDRHLSRACECGGRAEVYIDAHDDCYVRCDRCHKSTEVYIDLAKAISDWQAGITPLCFSLPTDDLAATWSSGVEFFAISESDIYEISNQSCDFSRAMAKVADGYIGVEHRRINERQSTIAFSECSDINREHYNVTINATPDEPISFICEIHDDSGLLTGLKFRYGDRYLLLYAMEYDLTLTKSIVDLENFNVSDLPEFDDSVLING